ncbi:AraC family transcriptional regulator [Oscillatoria laete-virens NRMC-F 0139]|nr:AraC family transcriptional regulator [Oscillatoria laete-virens]MDL5054126.1 AraC family transcriptional regulator [Oscillatoria laete-virens NRMC-F 0139]
MDNFDYAGYVESMRNAFVYSIEPSEEGLLPHTSIALHVVDEPTFNQSVRRGGEFDLHFVTEGALDLVLQNEERSVGAGEIFFCPPRGTYAFRKVEGQRFSCFHCHFDFPGCTFKTLTDGLQEWAHMSLQTDSNAAGTSRVFYLPQLWRLRDAAHFAGEFLKLIAAQRARRPGYELAASSRLLLLLQTLSEEVLEDLSKSPRQLRLSAGQQQVSRALDFIESHLNRNISLFDVARHLHVNDAYLARMFKAHTGTTLGQYVHQLKISKAKERLLTGTLTVKQVAKSLGYNDALYFSRRFQQVVGVSPSNFAKQH